MSFNPARAAELGLPRPERIRAVAFDAVGTLIFADPPVAAIYEEVGRRHGSRRTREEIARRFRAAFAQAEEETPRDERDWDRPDLLRCDEAGERHRWQRIVASVLDDAADPEACFEELFAHFARPGAWAAFPDVPPTLTELSDRGVRTAIVTNFDSRLIGVWRGMPELRPIDTAVVSSLVGYRKPSRFLYQAAVEALRAEPEECLMVGDDWTNDVAGARRSGLQAVYLRRAEPADGAAIRSPRDVLEFIPPRPADSKSADRRD